MDPLLTRKIQASYRGIVLWAEYKQYQAAKCIPRQQRPRLFGYPSCVNPEQWAESVPR